ncbi:TonB-dependent receptor domain-containing protein [Puia sp. P3]|uniref:TonB-dependent receptor domain-containing protein n=1 Tax=Puia sp. P3 TaxID=3423952 RepID=UPI003D67E434
MRLSGRCICNRNLCMMRTRGRRSLATGRDVRASIFPCAIELTPWLFANFDVNYCRARDRDAVKGQDYLPLAVPLSSTGGLDFRLRNGISGGLSYRYMKDRPASADNSLTAQGYFVTDLTANYSRSKWEVGLEVQNLLNRKWREAQFETNSRMRGEAAPVDGISFTPGVPLFAKVKVGVFF